MTTSSIEVSTAQQLPDVPEKVIELPLNDAVENPRRVPPLALAEALEAPKPEFEKVQLPDAGEVPTLAKQPAATP